MKAPQLIAMFLPLVLFFIGFGIIVNDLRHPVITRDYCKVMAVGRDVAKTQPAGRFIYRQSEDQLHDVSLQCNRFGNLRLNDLQLMQTPVKQGQDAEIKHKRFQFLPERWMVSVHTGKPQR